MNKSLALAGIVGVCLGAATPLIYKSLTSKPAETTLANAANPRVTVPEAESSTTEVATAPAQQESPAQVAPVQAKQQSYEEAVRQVEAENAKLQGNRDAYYQHTAEVHKESDALYRQQQQQGNIRAQQNLAAAKLQEQKDEAAEAEYNPGAYWNNWSAGDWYHVNRWSNGYIWRP